MASWCNVVLFFFYFQREEKLEDLNLLFINIHHLINELRPHQVNNWLLASTDLPNLMLFSVSIPLGKPIDFFCIRYCPVEEISTVVRDVLCFLDWSARGHSVASAAVLLKLYFFLVMSTFYVQLNFLGCFNFCFPLILFSSEPFDLKKSYFR